MNYLGLSLRNLFRRPAGLIASALTVAIASFVTLTAFGLWYGYDVALSSEVDDIGASILAIPKGCPYEATGALLSGAAIGYAIDTDLMHRARDVEGVSEVSGVIMGQRGAGEKNKVHIFYGVDENYFAMRPGLGVDLVLSENEIALGSDIASGMNLEIGDSLQVGGVEFEIVSVLSPDKKDDNSIIFMNIQSAWEILKVDKKLSSILIQVDNPDETEEVAKRLMEIPDLQVVTMNDFYETVQGFASGARIAIMSVLVVIILIAGIGVLLAQVSSVSSRRGEIGMMRSMGASVSQMVGLSLLDSIGIGLIGSVFGVALAYALAPTMSNLVKSGLPQAPDGQIIVINFVSVLVTLAILIVISVIANLIPAISVAKTKPVEAASE
ncbi:MAG TPA: FtsX-like permease family protein [Caldisericia bacterium]|nr:FtsX-like permease family protein [Caldisericia bacterium]HPF49497.1 FtsX-like permease family protein [Caldisericia bacterium]HPI84209.1 FtsX-like permease family protein [Caldisericia bacterium]HPQ93496.1 FtsX-like permease family protein [Caldisericia bacterium]HRV75498.1 FtsX-like permease family protein [Caldisericia bacterium]